MAEFDPIQVNRFVQLFPELPAEYAYVVMLYAAGVTQVEIAAVHGYPTIRQVGLVLHKASQILDLHSVSALRSVVNNRLFFAIYENICIDSQHGTNKRDFK